MLQATFFKKIFGFNFRARTSRGLMRDKTSWFVQVFEQDNPSVYGIGECGPLPGLSVDAVPELEQVLQEVLEKLGTLTFRQAWEEKQVYRLVPPNFPSLVFALETALADLASGGKRSIFPNDFTKGKPIPINGLIWMGDTDFMIQQVNDKIAQGYRCIKIKVGGLDFERECDILDYIRKRHYRENITIRLDANGAFKTDEALYKLEELARFNIHSIEQPIKPGLEEMAELCRVSPIPIALDEELIGISEKEEKKRLLEKLKPAFIILKPTLLGGFRSCEEWIELATQNNTGWWITSALESSVGLNAISQFTANYDITLEQGLGTGQIYQNNFQSPLLVESGNLRYDSSLEWNISAD